MSAPTDEECKKEKSAFDIIKIWFLNSPTHGLRRISQAKSTLGRAFWSFSFLIFTTFMSLSIYTVIIKFIAQPTKISLTIRQTRDQDHIPTITFCNLNPLRNENFLFESQTSRRSSPTDSESHDRFTEYMFEVLARNLNNSQPAMLEAGYKLNELLIQCRFNDRTCNESFSIFLHPNYGNCYTFKPHNKTKEFEQKNNSHNWLFEEESFTEGYKLSLELFLYQNEYIPYLDARAAFRIFIHRRNEIPILSQNSLFLAPRTFTKLIYSQRIITFSRGCRNDLTDDMKAIFNSASTPYSQALCYKLCEFRFIEKICQCTDQLLMVFVQYFSQNRTDQWNTSQFCPINHHCLDNQPRFNSKETCPECLPECELIQYTIQSSYAAYPNIRSAEKVYQRVEKHFKSLGNGTLPIDISTSMNNRKDTILNDIVAMEILAGPYATEVLAESPMYTWVDLISSIGGQTGLWIGVSLISFVEVAELLFLLLTHFIRIISESIRNKWKNLTQLFLTRKMSRRST